MLRFDDLKNTTFNEILEISVIKNEALSSTKEVILYSDSQLFYIVELSVDSALENLPKLTRNGYILDGWSLTDGGDKITNIQLREYLMGDELTYKLYAIWIKEAVDYSSKYISIRDNEPTITEDSTSGVKFTGNWQMTRSSGEDSIDLTVDFQDSGAFTYKLTYNGEVICAYSGEYRLDNNSISVISIKTEMEIALVNESEIGFGIGNGVILANIIYFEDGSVLLTPCELNKK